MAATDPPASAPKPSLTAWERWELGKFNDTSSAPKATTAVVPTPTFNPADIDRLREEATREGYQAGFDAGHAAGLQAGQAEALALGRAQAAHLARAVTQFNNAATELEKVVADELLALALDISRQIMRQTISVQPQVILGVIHAALAELPLHHALIRLNPEDAALVRTLAGDQLTHAGHRLHDDLQLKRGDVVIETGNTQLDAKLATRWQRTIAALTQDASWLASDISDPPP